MSGHPPMCSRHAHVYMRLACPSCIREQVGPGFTPPAEIIAEMERAYREDDTLMCGEHLIDHMREWIARQQE